MPAASPSGHNEGAAVPAGGQDATAAKGQPNTHGSQSASVLSARTPLCVDSRPFT